MLPLRPAGSPGIAAKAGSVKDRVAPDGGCCQTEPPSLKARRTAHQDRGTNVPIVRHRSGPLAGQEQQVDQRTDRITFGRDPAVCDVVFPPDLTLVARRHFALVRKPSGEWTFESFGDPFVGLNGEPAEQAQTVHMGDVIELGKRGGPSLELVIGEKALGDALPPTEGQEKVLGAHATARRTRRLALVGATAAVLATTAIGAFIFVSRNE